MSRSTEMRKLAGVLASKAGVAVEASYNQYSSDGQVGWYVIWWDGPTEATMRRWAATAAHGLRDVNAKDLRYRREHTELAVVVAFLARVLPQPAAVQEHAWQGLSIHRETEFPGRIEPPIWDMARFALAQPGVKDSYDESREAIQYIAAVGINGLRLDMWLASTTGEPQDRQPDPPVVDPSPISDGLRGDLERMIERVQDELIGGSAHRHDPRVRLLVAETGRQVLISLVDQHQRRIAVHALVDGTGLSSLSSMIGLAPRTLGMRWGKDLDADLAPLAWLRDHAGEWASACAAAAQAIKRASTFLAESQTRQDFWTLERCDPAHGWQQLITTPDAARRLLAATRQTSPRGTGDALDHLARLLNSYDRATPPGRRERALRKPARLSHQ